MAAPAPGDADVTSAHEAAPPAASNDTDYPTRPAGPSEANFLSPPQRPDELGRLAHFRVLKKLGAGGMGMVLLAEDANLCRPVALKVMLGRAAENPVNRERFLREARAAAAVRHDNVVSIYHVGEDRGVPFIVLELLKGQPLDAWLKTHQRMTVPQTLKVARETAEGLAAAHALGLVHRDIKPGNLWLEAPKGRVKILDFGLARPADDDAHLTQEGAFVGTPAYMSPEQARGEKVDARTDLFSLGVVLYRMLTGEPPFKGASTMAVLTSLSVDAPKPVSQFCPDVPPAFAELVARLLSKDPADRPATAAETAKQLRMIEREVALAARASTAFATGPAQSTAGLSVAATVVAGPRPERAKPRKRFLIAAGLLGAVSALAAGVVITVTGSDGAKTTVDVPDGSRVKVDAKGNVQVAVPPAPAPPALTSAGYALDFNHQLPTGKARIELPEVFALNKSLTVEMFVTPRDPDGTKPNRTLFSSRSHLFLVMWGQNTLEWLGGLAPPHSSKVTAWDGLPIDRRSHVAAVSTGTELRLFINGVPAGRCPVLLPDEILSGTIGRRQGFPDPSPDSQPFKGLIDGVRVSTTARYDAAFTPPAELEPDPDSLLVYDFREGKGDRLTDAAGHGHHGQIVGATWANRDGSPLAAPATDYALDTSEGCSVRLPVFLRPSDPFTIEMTATPTGTPPPDANNCNLWGAIGGKVIFKQNASHWKYEIFDVDRRMFTAISKRAAEVGKKAHLAAVSTGGEMRLFVNGRRGPVTRLEGRFPSADAQLGLGGRPNAADWSPFPGRIDEVRISKAARYEQNFAPAARFAADADTLALYHCDEGQGDVLTDSSGNARDGKITKPKWVAADGSK